MSGHSDRCAACRTSTHKYSCMVTVLYDSPLECYFLVLPNESNHSSRFCALVMSHSCHSGPQPRCSRNLHYPSTQLKFFHDIMFMSPALQAKFFHNVMIMSSLCRDTVIFVTDIMIFIILSEYYRQ